MGDETAGETANVDRRRDRQRQALGEARPGPPGPAGRKITRTRDPAVGPIVAAYHNGHEKCYNGHEKCVRVLCGRKITDRGPGRRARPGRGPEGRETGVVRAAGGGEAAGRRQAIKQVKR